MYMSSPARAFADTLPVNTSMRLCCFAVLMKVIIIKFVGLGMFYSYYVRCVVGIV